jgi:hypothetical protein
MVCDKIPIPILVKVIRREMPRRGAVLVRAGNVRQLAAYRPGGNSQRLQGGRRYRVIGAQQAQQHVSGADGGVAIGQCLLLGKKQNLPGRTGVSGQPQQRHHGSLPTGNPLHRNAGRPT